MERILKILDIKLFLFTVVLFFSLDFLSGLIIIKLFNNSKSGIVHKERKIFFETNEDALVFGSSRAAFHYVPDVFEKQLKMSFYNAGREGTGIYFHYALLISTLERYKPKLIVLDVDFRDVYDRGGDFGVDVFSQLTPYYGLVNDEFDDYVSIKPYDEILNQSNLIKFNKKFLNILTANISSKDQTVKGFKPLIGTWNGKEKHLNDTFVISNDLLNTLDDFIKKTLQNKIELLIVVSPTNKNIPQDFTRILDSIALNNNIKLFNFLDQDEIKMNKYFYDMEHLNEKGANKFSKILSESL
jgi:hypothetical protein